MDYTAQEKGERYFPDGVRDPCALDRQVENGAWQRQMEMLSTLGVSPYGAVDGATVHDIPSTAINGNGVGCKGNKFVGYVDTERGLWPHLPVRRLHHGPQGLPALPDAAPADDAHLVAVT
jgi:hypothetical protein